MFELALEDMEVFNVRSDKKYTPLQCSQIIENFTAIENMLMDLQRRGINANKIFRERFIQGIETPLYRVKTSKGEYFKFEGEDLLDVEIPEEPEKDDQLDMLSDKEETKNEVIIEDASDLPEIREIGNLLDKFAKKDIFPQDLFTDIKEKAEILFKIEEKKGGITHEIISVKDLLVKLVETGKRGINVQRYKGLSEMNPDQLRTTTMDPAVRTLIQIKLEDVVEADQMFTTLMGSKVEPRREFIEKHAMYVTNLDIYGA